MNAVSATKPVNILLVDDQPGKLLSYEAMLDGLGENLIRASSGNEALQHLLQTDIAVVLLDVCMPDVDGFEMAAMIRKHPRFQRTAIIHVSAVNLSDLDRLRGYDSGAVDYVAVPIVPEVLRARAEVVAAALGERASVVALRSTVGGGSLPGETLASFGLALQAPSANGLLDALRRGDPPVIGRIEDDHVVLDLRTVEPGVDESLRAAVVAALDRRA